jgi:hypothetical protein
VLAEKHKASFGNRSMGTAVQWEQRVELKRGCSDSFGGAPDIRKFPLSHK